MDNAPNTITYTIIHCSHYTDNRMGAKALENTNRQQSYQILGNIRGEKRSVGGF